MTRDKIAIQLTELVDKPKGREPGWREWLHRFDLWEGEDESAMYERYMKFSRIKFGVVPEEHWGVFYRDLLPFENGLVYGDKIGRVDRFAYRFRVADPRPIRHKPFSFPKRERQWVREYTETQCRLGVLRRLVPGVDPDPTFI